jgi:hypothetical protein
VGVFGSQGDDFDFHFVELLAFPENRQERQGPSVLTCLLGKRDQDRPLTRQESGRSVLDEPRLLLGQTTRGKKSRSRR